MKKENEKIVTDWLNNMIELAVKAEGSTESAEDRYRRRVAIIENPKTGLSAAIRYRAELIQGLEDVETVFPQWVRRLVLAYAANALLAGRDLHEVVQGYNETELNEGSLFPQLLAAFGSEWLCRGDRWKTKKFRRIIVKIK